jgi:uncharacterized protein YegP (UPF0339 family)
MFGKKKQAKQQQLKEAKEAEARAQEKAREEVAHKKLEERYRQAVEYDRRVAAGEDPELVEAEVYGHSFEDNQVEEIEQPQVEETPVEETEETPAEETEEAPVEETEETPVEETEETPVEETEEAPVEETEEAPVEETEEAPVEETEEAPVEETEETPVEETEEAPVEETEEAPVEETEETPVEEAEETPVEEAEETPVEEAEETPVEEAEETPAVTKTPKAKKAPAKKTPAKKPAKKVEEDASEKVLVEASDDDTTNGKYEIFQDTGGFKYRIVASNGQALATSEVYTTAKGAQNGIETLKSNLDTLVFRVETDKHRKSQFVGCTVQNKILVHSANYSSKSSAESAIDSFKNFAKATKIVLLNNEDESKPELVDRKLFTKAAGKGKFVILFNQDTLSYQFGLKASNGQLIVTSKFYKTDVSVKTAITKFKKDVKEGTFYVVRDKNDMYEFRLYNTANKLVQSGIAFDSKSKCLSNIESVIRFIDSELESK